MFTGVGMIPLLRHCPLGSVGLPADHPSVLHSSRVGLSTDHTPEREQRLSVFQLDSGVKLPPVESPPGDGRFELVFAAAIQTELLKCAGSVDGETRLLTSRR